MSDVYDDDDLFEPAKNEFPAKEDLKDRLVVIYPTGKSGERKSNATGKMYPWRESTTIVLDDGPDGHSFTDLVPSVKAGGPIVLTGFQWTPKGIEARMSQKPSSAEKVGSIVGRINSIKNKQKGLADPWSIAPPTEEDMALARQHSAVCAAARDEIKKSHQQLEDEAAF